MNHCATCKWWIKNGYDRMGTCKAIDTIDSDSDYNEAFVVTETLALRSTFFLTRDDFGCVLHEKEDGDE